MVTSPGLVELAVDVAGELPRDPRDRLELLAARGDDPLRRAEVVEERALARRPDAAELVEQRGGHRLPAAGAVVVEREPVRLVADPLQQPQRLRVAVDLERLGAAG